MIRAALIAVPLLLWAAQAWASPTQPFVQGSWQAVLKAHRGKPLVVHFWGLTCAPCMVEMPQWAALAQTDLGLDLVLVDADPVGDDSSGAEAMLQKMGLAGTESWRFADDFSERLRFEVDPKWHGELPLTLLIGRDGAVRKVVGSVDFAMVHAWVAGQEIRSSR